MADDKSQSNNEEISGVNFQRGIGYSKNDKFVDPQNIMGFHPQKQVEFTANANDTARFQKSLGYIDSSSDEVASFKKQNQYQSKNSDADTRFKRSLGYFDDNSPTIGNSGFQAQRAETKDPEAERRRNRTMNYEAGEAVPTKLKQKQSEGKIKISLSKEKPKVSLKKDVPEKKHYPAISGTPKSQRKYNPFTSLINTLFTKFK